MSLTRFSSIPGAVLGGLLLAIAGLEPTPVRADDEAVLPDARVAWARENGSDFEIWFSRTEGRRWSEPERLTVADEEVDLLACPIQTADGSTLVVWTRFRSPEEAVLMHAVHVDGAWSKPELVKTDLTMNMAVSLLRADDDTVWLIWAGYDGRDDDIFASRWGGEPGEWEVKMRIGRNDATPDILPIAMRGPDGQPVVRWQALGSSGYRVLQSIWKGDRWSSESPVDPDELTPERDVVARRLDSAPRLPRSLVDAHKACININDGSRLDTVRFPPPRLDATGKRNPVPGQQ